MWPWPWDCGLGLDSAWPWPWTAGLGLGLEWSGLVNITASEVDAAATVADSDAAEVVAAGA